MSEKCEKIKQGLLEEIRDLKNELRELRSPIKGPMLQIDETWRIAQASPVKQFSNRVKRIAELTETLEDTEARLRNISSYR
jgi:hypothetical protein